MVTFQGANIDIVNQTSWTKPQNIEECLLGWDTELNNAVIKSDFLPLEKYPRKSIKQQKNIRTYKKTSQYFFQVSSCPVISVDFSCLRQDRGLNQLKTVLPLRSLFVCTAATVHHDLPSFIRKKEEGSTWKPTCYLPHWYLFSSPCPQ